MSHNHNPFKSKEFTRLQSHWYQKLQKGGFNDIEKYRQNTEAAPDLKQWDSFYFQARQSPEAFQSRHDYYYYASHFMETPELKALTTSQQEREIWRLHSEGLSFRSITQSLNAHGARLNKDKVSTIVNRLKAALVEFIKQDFTETPQPKESLLVLSGEQYCFSFMNESV